MSLLKRFVCALGLLLVGLSAQAQNKGIPNEVYYLMPKFGQGYIYFRGQGPAQGQLNICAVDNTLRFLDKSGKEMEASNADNVVKVQIDTVVFLHHQDIYYRLSAVGPDMGLAIRRDVKILMDVKEAGYGTTSQTSSIRELGTLYTEGGSYELNTEREYPYRVSNVVFIYSGDAVMLPTKNNLRKLFPDKKDEVDIYFKSNRYFPDDVNEACALLSLWAGK